ncbi:MAG TPA: aminotransferase class I/II-fold pyridoxal phosphate-dependent enzyme [Gemmatimonadaceae bacterium]|nr:aminotransferase class I/II-fold pyridoxal phosphate-dependent enzyme [Gemmatimonadaceae bacterium]
MLHPDEKEKSSGPRGSPLPIDPADIAICLEDNPAREPGVEPMATPIVQTSLFAFPTYDALITAGAAESRNTVYTRGQNPTVEVLERKLAALERGEACKAFGSGMAAVSAVIMGLLKAGDHIVFVNHTYGPTLQLARHLKRFGIDHTLLLDIEPAAVEAAILPNTKLVWLENPGTMMFRTLDLGSIGRIARHRGALTCIDNSWASPLFQKPIEHGIDLVVHSATKYIGGHSDVVAGAVIGSTAHVEQIFHRAFLLNGGILHPFDAWLLLRGMRTMPVRMKQHEGEAIRVADYLRGRPEVSAVHHPALNSGSRSLTGSSGLFSFELANGEFEDVRRFIDRLKRFRIGVSWGGVESLVISPNRGTNLSYLDAQSIPHGLVRLSIGLEGADVLIADIAQALDSPAS